jgi:TonB family protein
LSNPQLLNPQSYNVDAYFALVRQRISFFFDWKDSEGSPGMKAMVRFRLDQSGKASEFFLQESSGNDAFDREAVKAVRWANPLPTIPSALGVSFLDGTMTFEITER